MNRDPDSPDRLILPGYAVLDVLHRGHTRVVCRARRDSDSSTVIVKTLAHRTPRAAANAALEREAGILERLSFPGVPRVLGLELRGNRPALVLEDLSGDPLSSVIRDGRLSLADRLGLARNLAEVVGSIHAHGIVHRDINPNNILVQAETLRGAIIDFGLATEPSASGNDGTGTELEGTPAYVSPEQTGRTAWGVDNRSDLYSFGATLYELFTGRRPFDSADPLKVVHAHIALQPEPPAAVAPDLPIAVSAVIMKLLAKPPTDRYQTAASLSFDLSRCLDQYTTAGTITPFELGTRDSVERISMPERLYGRDNELDAIQAALARAREEQGELLLVAGYSGIGKTSLVKELERLSGREGGRFVSGKFDQLVRGTPYTAIREAFVKLAQLLLGESDERVVEWRHMLAAAVGTSGQVILDLVPEFEPILGPQPNLPALEPAEAQNRFNRVFGEFVRVLASPNEPLVLFLDDLQWVDSASLDLIRAIFSGRIGPGLLVVGAYRDNEVDSKHPLFRILADLEQADTRVSRVSLAPLDGSALHEMVADTLHVSQERGAPLAELVEKKTGGNPFFVGQFMKSLAQARLIYPDERLGGWTYDLEGIRQQPRTDNVVDLLAARIEQFPGVSREVLEVAACLGNRFDLETLATAWGRDPQETVAALREALLEGLVVEAEDHKLWGSSDDPMKMHRAYQFLHDRVQQAAYALIPEAERPGVHMRIGRSLLEALDSEARAARAFELIDQIKPGLALVRPGEEQREVYELAIVAGRKAREATAYAEALEYFQTAVALLPADAWSSAYKETFELHYCVTECEYLSGHFEDAFRGFDQLEKQAATPLDGGRVQILRAAQYETMARYEEAVNALRKGLAPLGIALPTEDQAESALEEELDAVDLALGSRDIASLIDLPRMEDPATKMSMRLLMVAWAPSYLLGDSGMISWIPARMVRLSLEHGNTEESALGYVTHGFTLGTRRGDYRRGREFGLLALQLNEAFDDLALRGKVHELFGCFVNQWRRPLLECVESQHTALLAGIEGGDFAYGSYGGFVETWYGFLTGDRLADLEERYAPTLEFLTSIRNETFASAERLILNWATALRGSTEKPDSLTGGGFSEQEFLARYGESAFFSFFYWAIKLHLHVTLGQMEQASTAADEAQRRVHSLAGTIWQMLLRFYRAVACAARLSRDSTSAEGIPAGLLQDAAQLRIWSDNCPENFLHADLLVQAELARIRAEDLEAETFFAAAIEAAQKRGFPGDLALVNERYARYWFERGQAQIGSLFLLEALRVYDAWGALPKAEALAAELSEQVQHPEPRSDGSATGSVLAAPASVLATLRSSGEALDLEWTLNAAGAIASEIELEKLLSKLMSMLLECAGAERGCLVLTRDEVSSVRVEGDATAGTISVQDTPVTDGEALPLSLLRYVSRTRQQVVLEDASVDPVYVSDPYVSARRPRSVLCLPVLYQGELLGAVYLENNLSSGAFTGRHQRLLGTLSAHAAIAIRNAELFNEVAQLEERVRAENVYLQETIRAHHDFEEIIGDSGPLRQVLKQVEQVAPTDTTVLLLGETGTGKELLARAIHKLSTRHERPLVAVNCGAISPGLIESELFGHEKGAFTGAVSRKIGRFELADGSTIMLDEIGDLALDLQVKLLRVLEEGEIERVGGTGTIPVDVRVIAGTHRDLDLATKEGRFRADLFYRLNVFPIRIPPLRERRADIPHLVRYFLMKDGMRLGKRIDTIPKRTMDALLSYHWPGNVRELRNVIERSIITSPGPALELGDWLMSEPAEPEEHQDRTLDEVIQDHIERTLQQTGWIVSGPRGAAKRLGLKPTTLESRMKKLGIHRPS